MPPAYEVLLLNTAIPQIQAAQAGDTYVVPRDIAINATAIISANSATDALRITQTGAGNALVVEDSANPDATPFVVSAAGDVGIGTTSPDQKLQIAGGAGSAWLHATNTANSDGTYVGTASSGEMNLYQAGIFPIVFHTASTLRMTLDASGNLGLGATSPNNKLTVQADATGAAFADNGVAQIVARGNTNTAKRLGLGIDTTNNVGVIQAQLVGTGNYPLALNPAGGDVGIGTSSPITKLQVAGAKALASGTYGASSQLIGTYIGESTDGNLYAEVDMRRWTGASTDHGAGRISVDASANMIFFNNGVASNTYATTERARITSSGNLLVGDTAAVISADNRLTVVGSRGGEFKSTGGATANTLDVWNNATTGDNIFVVFRTETSDTSRGSITYNRTGGLVAYNTTSDYRAKDIIGPVANSGATIDALKIYNGKMKGATVERPMLIAHEAQEFAPYAVVGEKDAVNENGDPVFQQMDVSSLVPLLIAELQSLRVRVAQLEAK